MNNSKRKNREIKIDMGMFFNFYFAEEKVFSPLFRHLRNFAMSKKALLLLKGVEKGIVKPYNEFQRKLIMAVIETGAEEYKKIYVSSKKKALEELIFLSTLSRLRYGESMVGYIDTRNDDKCTNLLCTIIDVIYSDIGVDLSKVRIA